MVLTPIGAKFHVAMVVRVICLCAYVTCAHRPPNRHETSHRKLSAQTLYRLSAHRILQILCEDGHSIERLHVTSQTLRNHFRVAKEVCHHTHSTRSVVGVDATKHVQLPIRSEPTGSTMD